MYHIISINYCYQIGSFRSNFVLFGDVVCDINVMKATSDDNQSKSYFTCTFIEEDVPNSQNGFDWKNIDEETKKPSGNN